MPFDGIVIVALNARQELQILEKLMLEQEWQGEPWGHLVFPIRTAGPLGGENAYKQFQGVLRRAGLPAMRLHDLRHGAASMLAAAGVPPMDVMRLLGHNSVQTTLGVYTHSTEGVRREAMERLGRILDGSGVQ